MGIRFDEGGGFKALLGKIFSADAPALRRTPGETLPAPPHGRMWHQSVFTPGLFQLRDLVHHPIFEIGDIFGIHPEDPIPLPPSGTELLRLSNPAGAGDVRAAHIYQIVKPAAAMVLGIPKGPPPTLKAHRVTDLPWPGQGERWQVLGADGRNLNQLMGAMVAA